MARFILPVNGQRTQNFGGNAAYYKQYGQLGHNGWDIAVNTGTPVVASADGTIFFEGWGQNSSWMGAVAGIAILINHGDAFTGYAHLSSTIVSKGQRVVQGQLIGYSGATGGVTGPHVHFETFPGTPNWNNGYAGRVDPTNYIMAASQGDSKVAIIQDAENWYARCNKTHQQIRGRELDRATFKGFVGSDFLTFVEACSDDQEAETVQNWQNVGHTAVQDDWAGQIGRLLTALNEKPKEIEVIKEVPVEVIKEVVIGDDERSLGDLLSAAFKKLFKVK